MKKTSTIYVAGHTGLVGSAIVRALKKKGYNNIIEYPHNNNDLMVQSVVERIFNENKPEYVFLAAAKVGGINANMLYPGEFIRDNLLIQINVMEAARLSGVKKLLFLGSSCIYPKFAKQPVKEEYLMTGSLETSNIGYATAKIAGIEMCKSYRKQWGCNFISVMPCNLYGENDNFSFEDSHVLPAMIRKFHEAKVNSVHSVTLWGSGTVKREFLYIDDFADVLIFLMHNYNDPNLINVGAGEDISIKELAEIIKKIVGFTGKINWDTSMPDGTSKKLLDVSKINDLGWCNKASFENRIGKTYNWFKANYETIRK